MSEDYGDPEMTPEVKPAIDFAFDLLNYYMHLGRLHECPSLDVSMAMLWGRCVDDNGRYDDTKAKPIIDMARGGDPDALEMFRQKLPRLIEHSPLPPHARELHREINNGVTKIKGRKASVRQQDYYIAATVRHVKDLGYKTYAKRQPTRSRPSASACWIVKKALEKIGINKSTSAVEKAWEARMERGLKLRQIYARTPLIHGGWSLIRRGAVPAGLATRLSEYSMRHAKSNAKLLRYLHWHPPGCAVIYLLSK